MNTKRLLLIAALPISIAGVWLLASSTAPCLHTPPAVLADGPISPANPVKPVFVHHSSGGRWLADEGATCEPISDVSITGPTVGYTTTLYAFTAAVTPSNATPPITYTWSPAPDVGSSAVVSYTWAATGTIPARWSRRWPNSATAGC